MPRTDPTPTNLDLDEILVFSHVVHGGSFTAAARALAMPRSTVSRKLADLEARVGARLLQRTTRTVSLTDAGRTFLEHCTRILAAIEEAQQAISRLQAAPRGLLRVTTPLAFSLLGPLLAEYLRRFPDVRLDVVCTDRQVDLVKERFDLALRAGDVPDSSLVARRLGTLRRILVAAPAIAKKLRDARDLAELREHPCIAFTPEGSTWELQRGASASELALRPRMIVNDYEMLRSVACAGFGVALLPEHLCADDLREGRLVAVLKGWTAPLVPLVALYPSARHLSPKVTALLELLRLRLSLPGKSGK